MGKKYIIELLDDCPSEFKGIIVFGLTPEGQISAEPIPVEDLTPYTEPDLEQVRKEAYEEGYKKCLSLNNFGHLCVSCDKYEQGLADAWDAARKIYDISHEDRLEIFPEASTFVVADICDRYSASEAIEKIRQYEQRQEEQIQIGDEVKLKCGVSPAIYMQGTKGSDEIYLLFKDGSCGIHSKSEIERKTGRHFPEIATILENMRGEQDG